MNRRRLLTGLAGGMSLLAGCSGLFESGGEDTETQMDTDTETLTETQMTTAGRTAAAGTPTPTVAPTPTATATPPPTPTTATSATPGMTSGQNSAGFDSTKLQVYTNEEHSYTIKRPVGWQVETSRKNTVAFTSANGLMLVQAVDVPQASGSMSLEPFIGGYLKSFGEGFDDFERSDKKKIQLPNNHTGTVIHLSADQSSTSFRGKAAFVLVSGTIYVVMLLAPKPAYSSSVENKMTTIITSLTITNSGTQTATTSG